MASGEFAMNKAGAAVRSAPSLRRRLDPDGAEGAAVVLLDDLAACCGAVNPGVLAELARITHAHDQKRRQKGHVRQGGVISRMA